MSPQRQVAVVVGVPQPDPVVIDGKTERFRPLPGVQDDVKRLTALIDHGGYLANDRHPDFHVLCERSETARAEILGTIRNAMTGLHAGDQLIVALAGHGVQLKDVNLDEPERKDPKDEAFVAVDGQLLVDDDFAQLWSEIDPAVQIISIVDTCHSETIALAISDDHPLQRSFNLLQEKVPMPDWTICRTDVGPHRLALSACDANELARELPERIGLLTDSLLEAWATHPRPNSYREWWVQAAIRTTSRNRFQHPDLRYMGPDPTRPDAVPFLLLPSAASE